VVREPGPQGSCSERPVSLGVSAGARAKQGIDRWGPLVEGWLRGHTALVYAFLYLPIAVVVLYSFNDNRLATIWTGFTLKWYPAVFDDPVVKAALGNSFLVAIPTAILATTFGTMGALGLQRVGKKTRMGFDALTYVSIIVPEIVIALSTLVLFSQAFGWLNPTFGLKLNLGIQTIIAAHMLFNISFVLLLVRARLDGMDRTLVEASFDLFATPWRTFRQITFPQLTPAILAGFLLSFTFSFDDYVITSFVSGPGSSTLPLFIFGQVKKGVTPETNAVATMMLLFTLAMLAVGQFLLGRNANKEAGGGGMAAMIAEQR
jgi:spermidine/putrescine transport system permease protein